MFNQFISDIGTKNYKYDEFNNRLMSCTNGLRVDIDRYANTLDHEDLLARNE